MNGLVRTVKVIYRKPSPANQAHARLVMELLFFGPPLLMSWTMMTRRTITATSL